MPRPATHRYVRRFASVALLTAVALPAMAVSASAELMPDLGTCYSVDISSPTTGQYPGVDVCLPINATAD